VAAPRKVRLAWWSWKLISLALVEIVLVLVLLKQISEGEGVTESVAILVGIVVADVVLFLVLRRAAQKGEFRDYDE
jgi:uncharacterized membrane protein